jgi:hypothetical protein
MEEVRRRRECRTGLCPTADGIVFVEDNWGSGEESRSISGDGGFPMGVEQKITEDQCQPGEIKRCACRMLCVCVGKKWPNQKG